MDSDFFLDTIWNNSGGDDTWRAWVCLEESTDKVCGALVIQQFVHDSKHFCWGEPLNSKARKKQRAPNGVFDNVAEISVFCADHCGRYLLSHATDYVCSSTSYDFLVVASTLGAMQWYKSYGFQEVKAFRSKTPSSKKPYCHRIKDDDLTPDDGESRMLSHDGLSHYHIL